MGIPLIIAGWVVILAGVGWLGVICVRELFSSPDWERQQLQGSAVAGACLLGGLLCAIGSALLKH